VVSIFNLVL